MTSVTLVGPGAIGCAVAGALVDRADAELEIAARTPFPELVVEGAPTPVRAAVTVHTDPAAATSPVDVVLLATKTTQTTTAAPWLARLCGPDTVVAALQNGIGQRELVGPLAGDATVVPVVVSLPSDRRAPGHVDIGLPASLGVPDEPGGHRLAALFADTYVDVAVHADFHTEAWFKLISNCGVGAITALARKPNSILADPEASALCAAVIEEAAAVARADGAAIDPGVGRLIVDLVGDRASTHLSSLTTDRIAGVPSEWDARNGEVVRRAERHGVDVPLTRALTTLLRLGEPDH